MQFQQKHWICMVMKNEWIKMKWIIIIIKKTKEWKNEMKNINDDEDTKERDRNDKW